MSGSLVIIGGDAAGMSAASKARREDPELEIIVLERGEWASYGACGLPYYIKGEIKNIEDLIAIPPEIFREKRNIDLRLNHEVIRILPDEKRLIVRSKKDEYELAYHNLLISTGARPLIPNIAGVNSTGVFTLRNIDDGKKIREYLQKRSPEKVLIVGGGYIGLEMAEAFQEIGLKVYLVELFPHVLPSFGPEISEVVEYHLKKYIQIYLGKYVNEITETNDGRLSVQIKDKKAENKEEYLVTDMILFATGIKPEVSLAQEAGIQLGITGAIAVDEYGRTNYPDIYAAGDCAEVKSIVTNKSTYIPLALTANRNGRAIGSTIGGRKTLLAPVAGTAVVKVFTLEVASTGLIDLDNLHRYGFDPVKITVDSPSRAGYYPGSKMIKISLIADRKTKKILGCSMVGEEGVAKRIDIIATALYSRLTVEQLENLDLAYAPPFSPVWDPILSAARVLNGKL